MTQSKRVRSIFAAAAFMLLLAPGMAMARGTKDNGEPYGATLTERFQIMLQEAEDGTNDTETAMMELLQLRQSYGRADSPDYRAMERLLDEVRTRTKTRTQAENEFYGLNESCVGLSASQLRDRDRLRDQDRLMDGTAEGDQLQTRTMTSRPESASTGGNSPAQGQNARSSK